MADYSVGEQIVQQMADALNTAAGAVVDEHGALVTKGTPCATFRTRVDAFASEELPARVLYAIDEGVERVTRETLRRTRTVRLEHIVHGEPPADRILDPLYANAVSVLHSDPVLGPMVRQLTEARTQWETDSSYEDACIAVTDFHVVFCTTNDPTVRA